MEPPLISAIICTHNPRADFLNRTLAALVAQSLARAQWELIIVDSGSEPALNLRADVQIPAGTRVVRLDHPGLAVARQAGAQAASAPLLASVDDDTVFEFQYLATALEFMNQHPEVASCGGKFDPEFESPPPSWFHGFETMIALRDLGPEVLIVPGLAPGQKLLAFPPAAPIGVNVTRRSAYVDYQQRWARESARGRLGRSGKSLASGEDNDFALCCLESGAAVAYVPALHARHLIPTSRLQPAYLAQLNRASSRSWVQVLALHGLCPWAPIAPWTVPLRQLKAWFSGRAWSGPAEWVRWQGICGQFEALAELRQR